MINKYLNEIYAAYCTRCNGIHQCFTFTLLAKVSTYTTSHSLQTTRYTTQENVHPLQIIRFLEF